MRKVATQLLLLVAVLGFFPALFAQDKPTYQFTNEKVLEITPIQDQGNSGTCWSFSGLGFLEIEALRESGIRVNLSPMFIVAQSYKDKGRDYIRYHGHLNFAQGGAFGDVLTVVHRHGIVPITEMQGLEYGTTRHAHSELEAVSKGFLDGLLEVMKKANNLTIGWKPAYDGIIDTYLGKAPETFTFNGTQYTPKSFRDALGLDMENYVSITSYTHHPFYTSFVLEIPDNWRHGQSYNVPIEELEQIMDNAIRNNYAVAWGGDVSEPGFTRDGLAVLIDANTPSTFGSDQERWVGASPSDRRTMIQEAVRNPNTPEIQPDQAYRQKGFENLSLTDDHGMVAYGIVRDQNGRKFYLIKNSWGETGKYEGVWYMSEAFVKGKTMNIVVHKDAIPTPIRKKLGI